jgi:cyclohexyl-isocyanide hydratase
MPAAIPEQGRVVRDGDLITASSITSGVDFGLTVTARVYEDYAARRAGQTSQRRIAGREVS